MSKSDHAKSVALSDALNHEEASAPREMEIYAMPATLAQERFWSLDQLRPGNPALNMPLMWQCSGDLNVEALHHAWKQCLERHESLRTTFSMSEGRLCQIIHPSIQLTIPLDDLSKMPEQEQRLAKEMITRSHAAFAFDLNRGPLLELRLVRSSPKNHLLLVTYHHIICDGISNGILMRDMLAFYEAHLRGVDASLPALPLQFADYAVWLDHMRTTPEHAAGLQFWRETLGNDFTPIRLTHDTQASSVLPEHLKSSTGAIDTLLIPPDLVTRANVFCQAQGTTFNVLLMSVFTALLSRLTGQHDLTIGSPTANRSPETEDVIGLFMNIHPMRARLSTTSTFEDLLGMVNHWMIGASEHPSLLFEDLVHDPFFGAGKSSLQVPVFFLYQPSFMLPSRIVSDSGSLHVTPLRSESSGAIFEMMLAVVDRQSEGPRLQMEYNPQFYKSSTVQRYLRFFNHLLEAAITSPVTLVDDLQLLSPDEQQQILRDWNDTAVDFGPFIPVQEIFLRQAVITPRAIAVLCADISYTYFDLSIRAKAFALHLLQEGIEPGDRVALCLGYSADTLSAILGVLLAGAVYVPLDIRYPAQRLADVVVDSGTKLFISEQEVVIPSDVKTLLLRDIDWTRGASNALPRVEAGSLAYVIYTSGSTGKPKGVAITHGSLANLLLSVQRTPGIVPEDVLVSITTISFDIATMELLLPLTVGARVVIATYEEAKSPTLLLTLLSKSKATIMQATPGAWRNLIDEGWSSTPALKVLCGGAALSTNLAENLLDRSDSVWNMYGPTETTIWSSVTRVTREALPPPVGRPIANTQMYVLDNSKQLLPVGLIGELYIGGAGLAKEYWRQPELTMDRFVSNPFGAGLLYRTGDVARLRSDGTIDLLGRSDFQVKVRGYRIELGEIERALQKHSSVREAVVVQHTLKDRPGLPNVFRMVAYVDAGALAAEEFAPKLISEIEENLSKILPEYMMPNVIVALSELPRLVNGKIDRKALPDVFLEAGDEGVRISATDHHSFQAPRDFLERQLAEIWQTTLGIERISIKANFFSLGVGSLAALRLITKLNRYYAMDLGLASLISNSTIESIASLIRERHSVGRESSLVPVKTSGSLPPLFIVHGVGGNIINLIGLIQRLGDDQPVYAIQSQSLLSGQPALLRLEDIATHYVRDLRKIQPHGPYFLLGYSFGGTMVLEMAHQLCSAGEKVALLGMLDSRSRSYEKKHRRSMTVNTKLELRVKRLIGNTNRLTWSDRVTYVASKLRTRCIRFLCRLAVKVGVRQIPSFLKSAYDVNYVAMLNYVPKPYRGGLVLFRASEQDYTSASQDLGWKELFVEGVEVHEITGDHERIFLEPSVDILAMELRNVLHRALEGSSIVSGYGCGNENLGSRAPVLDATSLQMI